MSKIINLCILILTCAPLVPLQQFYFDDREKLERFMIKERENGAKIIGVDTLNDHEKIYYRLYFKDSKELSK